MSDLQLGVIGMSEGNGHPYSWSAIFNGYNKKYMAHSGFPVILNYLEKQDFPSAQIDGARVTHVWTQDKRLSSAIANASNIPRVVDNYQEMIGKVDAILLARDDANSHYPIASCFMNAGLPIYVDKPLATSVEEAEKIIALEQYRNQLFTCSALRYAQELTLTDDLKEKIGRLHFVRALSPKSWEKYAIHIIEPTLQMIQSDVTLQSYHSAKGHVSVSVESDCGVFMNFSVVEQSTLPISIQVFGDKGATHLVFNDSFSCFKRALQDFIKHIKHGYSGFCQDKCLQAISIVEMGLG